MRAQQCGKHVLLVFDAHIGSAISVACQQSYDEDAIYMAKAAEIVRRDLFTSHAGFTEFFPVVARKALSHQTSCYFAK